MLFELDRRAVLDRRVQAFGVNQWTQAAVSRSTSDRPVQECCRSISSVLYRPMVDSISALSRASPTEPIEPAMPASVSASVNASDVYCPNSTGGRNTGLSQRE